MTGRRRLLTARTSRITRTVRIRALCTAVAASSLLVGCGVIPGTSGGSKDPITVMTWAPVGTNATNMPGMPAMAKAYARWVNASGGLGGHELRVLTCNERNTPAAAADCARRAVKEKAVAVVGSYSQFGNEFMAPLEAASIPYLGGYGISEKEFTSFLSYPVNGGQAALMAGNGMQLAPDCDHTALVRPDTTTGDDLPALLDSGLSRGKRGPSADVRAPDDATDYTKQAENARERAGDGGCVTAALGEKTSTFFDSYRRVPDDGRKIRVSSVLGSVGQSLIDSTGGKNGPYEGALLTGWYPVAADPVWKPMRDVIDKHAFQDDSIDPADPGVQTTWIAYTALKAVVDSIDADTITSGKITNALNRGVRVNTGGLTPTLRWRYQDMLGAPGFPRIVNRDVTFQVVREGRLVADRDGFVDVGATLGA